MISDKRKNLHMTVPTEIFEMLKSYSEATHRSMSQTVTDLVLRYCKLDDEESKEA